MTVKRTIVIQNEGEIHTRKRQLVFRDKSGDEKSVPIEDVGQLVVENQHVLISAYTLDALAQARAVVLFCDGTHLPSAQLLPFSGHTESQRILALQTEMPKALKEKLWKQVVVAKLRNQATCLRRHGLTQADEVENLSKFVHAGDPENREGQAAALYFRAMGVLRRNSCDNEDVPMPNPALNYGYALLRASMARALATSGLLCQLGIHHHGKYDPFVLADDLMEPYRPFVDDAVLALRERLDLPWEKAPFGSLWKTELLRALTCDVAIADARRPLLNALSWTSASFVDCLEQTETKIKFPAFPA